MKKSKVRIIEKYDATLDRHAGLTIVKIRGVKLVAAPYNAYEVETKELGWKECPTLSICRSPNSPTRWHCVVKELGLVLLDSSGKTRKEALERAFSVLGDLSEEDFLHHKAPALQKYKGLLQTD